MTCLCRRRTGMWISMSTKVSTDFAPLEVERFRHKREMPLAVFALAFSLGIYVLVTYLAFRFARDLEITELIIEFFEFEEDLGQELLRFGAFFVPASVVVVYAVTFFHFFKNRGETVSCDIPVTERQFPNLHEVCSVYSQRLGLKRIPELYITEEGSAEVETSSVTFKSAYYIRIEGDRVLTALESEDYTVLHFLIASELAHIALGHTNMPWVFLTLPARLIPLFQNAISRMYCYSADRVAAALIGKKEAIDAVIALSCEAYIAEEIDRAAYMRDIMEKRSRRQTASCVYYNLISKKPIPAYRLKALLSIEEDE